MDNELERIGDNLINWIPKLFSAILIFIVGWVIAYAIKKISIDIMRRIGLNRRIKELPGDNMIRKIFPDPAASIGGFFYWLIMIITITIVIGALNIPVLTNLVNGIYSYVPNILAAIIILALAISASAFVGGVITRWMGNTPTGKFLSGVIPVIILSISGFAILEQLKIAPVIVVTTYIAIIGTFSVATALAFGLGGRDVAKNILERAYDKASRGMTQVRRDVKEGQESAKADIERTKRKYRG